MDNHLVMASWREECGARVARIADTLKVKGIDAALLAINASLYYVSGRIFAGYAYVTAAGEVKYFVRRPVGLEGDNVYYIRKPEQIADTIAPFPNNLALELDLLSYSDVQRLKNVFPDAQIVNLSPVMREIRAQKSEFEIELLKQSGLHHRDAYKRIPEVFKSGMTDIELQIEIERLLRLEGCLGQFRIAGQSMEIFMGNILAGDNADAPTPYDFAMGGAGMDPSLPVGANGTVIKQGDAVMVDACGNFTGYMTDMSRVFSVGTLDGLAMRCHQLSIDICHKLAEIGKPGVEAKSLYETAMAMVEEAGLASYFMGHKQKAGFIGHGVGIEVNEAPVLAPRSRDVLSVGNVIALEPKFVVPGVGAVGIENTYVVLPEGMECITLAPEEIIEF